MCTSVRLVRDVAPAPQPVYIRIVRPVRGTAPERVLIYFRHRLALVLVVPHAALSACAPQNSVTRA